MSMLDPEGTHKVVIPKVPHSLYVTLASPRIDGPGFDSDNSEAVCDAANLILSNQPTAGSAVSNGSNAPPLHRDVFVDLERLDTKGVDDFAQFILSNNPGDASS